MTVYYRIRQHYLLKSLLLLEGKKIIKAQTPIQVTLLAFDLNVPGYPHDILKLRKSVPRFREGRK